MGKKISIVHEGSPESILSLSAAISGLRARYQGAEIDLYCREQSAEAAALLPELNSIQIGGEPPENADTYWVGSGFAGADAAQSPEWDCYAATAPFLRLGNSFHLVDLARKVLRVDEVDSNYELLRKDAGDSAVNTLLEQANGLKIVVCASTLSKENIQSLLQGLLGVSMACEVFCVGTVKDRKISAEITNPAPGTVKFHDLCGHISFLAAAQLAHACDIMICGPGSSALLASGYGTFTVCVDVNPERGPAFYPYGHGHLVIQSHQGQPLQEILEGLFRDIAQFAVTGNGGMLPSIPQWQTHFEENLGTYLGKARILATQRVETALEEGGTLTELQLKPLVYMGAEYYDAMQSFYRLLWELSFSGRNFTTHDLQILHTDTIPALCELLKPLEQIYELARFGSVYCQQVQHHLARGDVTQAKKSSEKLQEVDDLIRSLGSTYAALEALCFHHLKSQDYIDADNPILLAKDMQQAFSDLQSRVLVLLDLKKTLFHTNLRNDSALLNEYAVEGLSDG